MANKKAAITSFMASFKFASDQFKRRQKNDSEKRPCCFRTPYSRFRASSSQKNCARNIQETFIIEETENVKITHSNQVIIIVTHVFSSLISQTLTQNICAGEQMC